jgi:hypothetical protein
MWANWLLFFLVLTICTLLAYALGRVHELRACLKVMARDTDLIKKQKELIEALRDSRDEYAALCKDTMNTSDRAIKIAKDALARLGGRP